MIGFYEQHMRMPWLPYCCHEDYQEFDLKGEESDRFLRQSDGTIMVLMDGGSHIDVDYEPVPLRPQWAIAFREKGSPYQHYMEDFKLKKQETGDMLLVPKFLWRPARTIRRETEIADVILTLRIKGYLMDCWHSPAAIMLKPRDSYSRRGGINDLVIRPGEMKRYPFTPPQFTFQQFELHDHLAIVAQAVPTMLSTMKHCRAQLRFDLRTVLHITKTAASNLSTIQLQRTKGFEARYQDFFIAYLHGDGNGKYKSNCGYIYRV